MDITLDEIRAQVALGTITDDIRQHIWEMTDKEALKILGGSNDAEICRAVSINIYTPFSVLKQMYTSNPDRIARECAWGQIAVRYLRRFNVEAPHPNLRRWSDIDSSLPDDVIIYHN